jgi:CBS domain containing-hemolysin-like protein
MAEKGSTGAEAALRLLDNQARFLSSVQIGITLFGVLAGAFGGATVAEDLADWLQELGLRSGTAETVGVAVVVAAILDVAIRGGHVQPVAEQLLARGIPFVLASGYGDWSLPENLRDQLRLTKPFTPADLEQQVKLLCARRR